MGMEGAFAVLYGPNDIRIEKRYVSCDDDQALIRIRACGVCPTDVRSYTGLRRVGGYPRTLGHEWVGEIVETGKNFVGYKVGDRVAADWRVVCGNCYFCRRGIFNYCQNTRGEKVRGGFAEYGVAISSNLRLIPDNLSFEEATFAEPLACCINGNRRSNISFGDDVLIIGCGPIGLLHVQLSKRSGARVIACDPIRDRLEKARQLGADDVISPEQGDVRDKIIEMTGGRGVNSVIVAVGSPETAKLAIEVACISGTVNFFAGTYPPGTIELDPNIVHYKELSITGSHDFTPHDFSTALKLIEHGIVNVQTLITHTIPLNEIALAFDTVAQRKGLKVVVKID